MWSQWPRSPVVQRNSANLLRILQAPFSAGRGQYNTNLVPIGAQWYQCSTQAGRRATDSVKGNKTRADRCLQVLENAYSRSQVRILYPSQVSFGGC
jgi:hypothetical protein